MRSAHRSNPASSPRLQHRARLLALAALLVATAVLAEARRLEKILSAYDAEAELAKLNATLDQVTRRADNRDLLSDLPDTGVDVEDIVSGVEDGRTAR